MSGELLVKCLGNRDVRGVLIEFLGIDDCGRLNSTSKTLHSLASPLSVRDGIKDYQSFEWYHKYFLRFVEVKPNPVWELSEISLDVSGYSVYKLTKVLDSIPSGVKVQTLSLNGMNVSDDLKRANKPKLWPGTLKTLKLANCSFVNHDFLAFFLSDGRCEGLERLMFRKCRCSVTSFDWDYLKASLRSFEIYEANVSAVDGLQGLNKLKTFTNLEKVVLYGLDLPEESEPVVFPTGLKYLHLHEWERRETSHGSDDDFIGGCTKLDTVVFSNLVCGTMDFLSKAFSSNKSTLRKLALSGFGTEPVDLAILKKLPVLEELKWNIKQELIEPTGLVPLERLRIVDIRGLCGRIGPLFEWFASMPKLERLSLEGSTTTVGLGDKPKVTLENVKAAYMIGTLFDGNTFELMRCPKLESLSLKRTRVVKISSLDTNYPNVKFLKLDCNHSLTQYSLGGCKQLVDLYIIGGSSMQLISGLGSCPKLCSVRIANSVFPTLDFLRDCTWLEHLCLQEAVVLRGGNDEFEFLGQLTELKSLCVDNCNGTSALMKHLKPKKLRTLSLFVTDDSITIGGMKGLERPKCLSQVGLKTDSVRSKSLAPHKRYLTKDVRYLSLRDNFSLERLDGPSKQFFQNLVTLDLAGSNIRDLGALKCCHSLRYANLQECEGLRTLHGLNCRSLQELDLSYCSNLARIGDIRSCGKTLRILDLECCSSLKDLNGIQFCIALKKLRLRGCRNTLRLGHLFNLQLNYLDVPHDIPDRTGLKDICEQVLFRDPDYTECDKFHFSTEMDDHLCHDGSDDVDCSSVASCFIPCFLPRDEPDSLGLGLEEEDDFEFDMSGEEGFFESEEDDSDYDSDDEIF